VNITKYVRYSAEDKVSYGILDGTTVRELRDDLFENPTPTGKTLPLSAVRLLAPCVPSKVLAVGLNYRSHLGNDPMPVYPGLFFKAPTTIIGPDDKIVYPEGATDVHYEAEMVVVIGKKAKNVSVAEASSHIFGITAGNDVSERYWQDHDLQWFRGKGCDTFGPIGPAIVRGLDYKNVQVQSRLNGQVKQSQRTSDQIFDADTIVSYISKFVTLVPGDIIFTGTPGETSPMKAGDVIEIEVEGVGTLRNTIA